MLHLHELQVLCCILLLRETGRLLEQKQEHDDAMGDVANQRVQVNRRLQSTDMDTHMSAPKSDIRERD